MKELRPFSLPIRNFHMLHFRSLYLIQVNLCALIFNATDHSPLKPRDMEDVTDAVCFLTSVSARAKTKCRIFRQNDGVFVILCADLWSGLSVISSFPSSLLHGAPHSALLLAGAFLQLLPSQPSHPSTRDFFLSLSAVGNQNKLPFCGKRCPPSRVSWAGSTYAPIVCTYKLHLSLGKGLWCVGYC